MHFVKHHKFWNQEFAIEVGGEVQKVTPKSDVYVMLLKHRVIN